jgi:hypothetical protein
MTQIPSDNHIRNLLDPVPPSTVFPVFSSAVDALHGLGHLEPYRSINGNLLVALDGTQYFSSSKIHCENRSTTEHKNGTTTYSHTVVTPVIVAPDNPRVIPLEPAFITPQSLPSRRRGMAMRSRIAKMPRQNVGCPTMERDTVRWV